MRTERVTCTQYFGQGATSKRKVGGRRKFSKAGTKALTLTCRTQNNLILGTSKGYCGVLELSREFAPDWRSLVNRQQLRSSPLEAPQLCRGRQEQRARCRSPSTVAHGLYVCTPLTQAVTCNRHSPERVRCRRHQRQCQRYPSVLPLTLHHGPLTCEAGARHLPAAST